MITVDELFEVIILGNVYVVLVKEVKFAITN